MDSKKSTVACLNPLGFQLKIVSAFQLLCQNIMIEYNVLEKALRVLQEHNAYRLSLDSQADQILHDALAVTVVHEFQICHDCVLKALKKHLREEEGVELGEKSKEVFRVARNYDLLPSPIEIWFNYIRIRNHSAHDYGRDNAQIVLEKIDKFIVDVEKIYQNLIDKQRDVQ
ncbi:MAG: nucleotidyltransferase substrate binding protein [Gammaproteobacteria bacterium]|nr:nucleotidyltransferase substrate binding protein [Gammaproteobacteria bacterium]